MKIMQWLWWALPLILGVVTYIAADQYALRYAAQAKSACAALQTGMTVYDAANYHVGTVTRIGEEFVELTPVGTQQVGAWVTTCDNAKVLR